MTRQPTQPDENPKPHDPEDDYVDGDDGDDAVIAVAFRRSLGVIVALALIGGIVFLWLQREEAPEAERTLEAAAPEAVEVAEAVVPALPFTNVTAEAGVDFVHRNGAEGEKLLPETMGSGVALFDADGDGDPDLLLANGTAWPHGAASTPKGSSALYRNDGYREGGGTIELVDITAEAGLVTDHYGTGMAVGDVDADGDLDVFLAVVGENRLLRNDGGRFVDVTASSGVAGDAAEWSTCAAFFDGDGDGDLDLFVCNYVRWSRQIDAEVDYRLTGVGRAYGPPVNYRGTFPYYYRNDSDGDQIRFTDVSAESGVQVRNPATDVPVAKALGVAPVDVEGDGDLDLLVANDTVGNFLFLNRGDGTFEEVGELYGLAYGRAGEATGAMGIDAGRYRNDGDLGFAIGNFANEMTSVYMSQGDASLFADEAISEGVGAPSRRLLTFGVLLLDLDLDGRLDLLQTNGHLENEIASVDPSQSFTQASQLFWNAGPDQRASFVEVDLATVGDLAEPIVGRSSAAADLDGDGDLDLVLTQVAGPPLVLRNDQDLRHRWLRVRLRDPAGANHDGIGAWVRLTSGGVTQSRQVMPTRGYQSQSEITLTFGLGDADGVDSLEIQWPDGATQGVDTAGLDLDRMLVIDRE